MSTPTKRRARKRRTVSADRKAFVAACIDSPTDRKAKLAFADWCDESGEPLAAVALRWLAKHGKAPVLWHGMGWGFYCRGLDDKWHVSNLRRRRMPQQACWLPNILGQELTASRGRFSRDWFALVRWLGRALSRIRELVD